MSLMAITTTTITATAMAATTVATSFATTLAAFAATLTAALTQTLTATITTTITATITTAIKTIKRAVKCALPLRAIHRRISDWRHDRENRAGQSAQKHQIEAHAPTILPRLDPGRRGWKQKHDRESGGESQIRLQPRALRAGEPFLTHHPFGEGDGVFPSRRQCQVALPAGMRLEVENRRRFSDLARKVVIQSFGEKLRIRPGDRQRGDSIDDPAAQIQQPLRRLSSLFRGQTFGRPAEGRAQSVELSLSPIFLVILKSVE